MELFLMVLILSVILFFGFRTAILYRGYNGSILKYFFPNYLSYAFQSLIRQDLSESSYLKQYIGDHHLTYCSIRSEKNSVLAQVIQLSDIKHDYLFLIMDFKGRISGREQDEYLNVKQGNVSLKIKNPIGIFRKQGEFLQGHDSEKTVSYLIVTREPSSIGTALETVDFDHIQTQLKAIGLFG